MKVRAAVAREAKKPLSIETVDLDGPREGEVLVEIKATGICHTDEYTLSGMDSEGLFHVLYFRLVAAAYRSGDMSLAYPLCPG